MGDRETAKQAQVQQRGTTYVEGAGSRRRAKQFFAAAVLESDDAHLVIQDPDGEIHKRCAEHRESLGPCHRVAWNSPANAGVNVFDSGFLNARGTTRREFVDAVATAFFGAGSGAQGRARHDGPAAHFASRAHGALIGMTHYVIARHVGHGQTLDGKTQKIPALGLIAELAHTLASETRREPEKTTARLRKLVAEARKQNYPKRTERELTPLALMAPKELSGTLSTLDDVLAGLRDATIAATTSTDARNESTANAVSPALLDGERPATVFITGENKPTHCALTALLLDRMAHASLCRTRGAGRRVRILLNGFADFDRADSLVKVLDLGRSRESSLMIGTESESAMRARFTPDMAACLTASTLPGRAEHGMQT